MTRREREREDAVRVYAQVAADLAERDLRVRAAGLRLRFLVARTDERRALILRELYNLPTVAELWQRAYEEAFARILAQEIQRDAARV